MIVVCFTFSFIVISRAFEYFTCIRYGERLAQEHGPFFVNGKDYEAPP